MIKRIHINMHNIRYNKKHSANKPVISVKTSKTNHYANNVIVNGTSQVIYRPERPQSCGAKVWIETVHPVLLDGKEWIGKSEK